MLRKDTLLTGVIFGIAFPLFFFFIVYEINEVLITHIFKAPPGISEHFRAILSICMNIIPFTIFVKVRKGYAMRGVLLATFLLGFIAMVYYRADFFNL